MAPDVSFHLTNEAFDRFAELLQPHGITVRDAWRDTGENLERGSIESDERRGLLCFGGFEFSYFRHKSFSDDNELMPAGFRYNPNVQVFKTYFSVTITGHEPKVLEQLFLVLERAFPQPERALPSLPRPRPWTFARVRSKIGCFLILFAICAICFFLFLGVRTYFHTP